MIKCASCSCCNQHSVINLLLAWSAVSQNRIKNWGELTDHSLSGFLSFFLLRDWLTLEVWSNRKMGRDVYTSTPIWKSRVATSSLGSKILSDSKENISWKITFCMVRLFCPFPVLFLSFFPPFWLPHTQRYLKCQNFRTGTFSSPTKVFH